MLLSAFLSTFPPWTVIESLHDWTLDIILTSHPPSPFFPLFLYSILFLSLLYRNSKADCRLSGPLTTFKCEQYLRGARYYAAGILLIPATTGPQGLLSRSIFPIRSVNLYTSPAFWPVLYSYSGLRTWKTTASSPFETQDLSNCVELTNRRYAYPSRRCGATTATSRVDDPL